MRSPTRSAAATWTRWPTSSAISSSRSSSMPAWPRKPAHFTLDDVLDGDLRQDGAPPSAHLRRRRRRRPPLLGGAQGRGARRKIPTRARSPASPSPFPPSKRAEKLQRRAARTGFDWPDVEGPRPRSTRSWARSSRSDRRRSCEDEVGDLLFAVVNYARHLDIDPEDGAARSQSQVRKALPQDRGRRRALNEMNLDEMEALWVSGQARSGG